MIMHVNPLFSGQSIHWIFTVQKMHQANKTTKESIHVTVRAGVHHTKSYCCNTYTNITLKPDLISLNEMIRILVRLHIPLSTAGF